MGVKLELSILQCLFLALGLSMSSLYRGTCFAIVKQINDRFWVSPSSNLADMDAASRSKSACLLHNLLSLRNWPTGILLIVCPGWLELARRSVLPVLGFLNKFETNLVSC